MKSLNVLVKEAEDTLKVMREGLNKYFHQDENNQLVPNLPESIQLEEPRQMVQRSISDKQFHTDREDVETLINSYLDPISRADEEDEDEDAEGISEIHLKTISEKSETEQSDPDSSKAKKVEKPIRISNISGKSGKSTGGKNSTKRSSSRSDNNYFTNLVPGGKLPSQVVKVKNSIMMDRITRKSHMADETGFLEKYSEPEKKPTSSKRTNGGTTTKNSGNQSKNKSKSSNKNQKIHHKEVVDIYIYDDKTAVNNLPENESSDEDKLRFKKSIAQTREILNDILPKHNGENTLSVQRMPSLEIPRELVVQKVLDIDIKSDENSIPKYENNTAYKEYVHDESSKESFFHVESFDPVTIEPGNAICDCAIPPKNDILSSPNVIYYEHSDTNKAKDLKLHEERLLDRISKISESLRTSMDLLTESQKVTLFISSATQTAHPPDLRCVTAQTKNAEFKEVGSQMDKAMQNKGLKMQTIINNDIKSMCNDECTCEFKGECECSKASPCNKEIELSNYNFENNRVVNTINPDEIPSKECDDCGILIENVIEKLDSISIEESPPSYNTNSSSNKSKKKSKEESVSKWKTFLGKISDSDDKNKKTKTVLDVLDKTKCSKTEQPKRDCVFRKNGQLRKLKIKNMQSNKKQGMEQCETNFELPACCTKAVLQNDVLNDEYVLVRDISAQISIESEIVDYCRNFSIDDTCEGQLEPNALHDLYNSYGNKHFDALKQTRNEALNEMESFNKRPSVSYLPTVRRKSLAQEDELEVIQENENKLSKFEIKPPFLEMTNSLKAQLEPSTSFQPIEADISDPLASSEDDPVEVIETKRESINKFRKKQCNKQENKPIESPTSSDLEDKPAKLIETKRECISKRKKKPQNKQEDKPIESPTSSDLEDKPAKLIETKRECISKWKKHPNKTNEIKTCNKAPCNKPKKIFHVQLEYDLPKSIRNDPLGDGPIDCMKYIKACNDNCKHNQLKYKPRKSKMNLHHLFRPVDKMRTSYSTPVKHDESVSSEGEVRCRCCVSSGELHLCKPWKNMQSLYYMKDDIKGSPFDFNSKFTVARHRQINNNVVSYYVSRSPSPGLIHTDLSES